MFTVNDKIEHLKKLGFSGDFTELVNMYEGKPFEVNDENYKRLLNFSNSLCEEFTDLSRFLIQGGEIAEKAINRKKQILDILFPGHGMLFGGGDGLKAVIGLVDFDGMNYINTKIDFGKTSLVKIGEYVFIANDVNFGSRELGDRNHLDKIEVKPDTWICAGVNILDGSIVGGKSVVTLGSVVTANSNTKDETIIVGNPAKSKHSIIKNYISTKDKPQITRSDNEVKAVLQHVKNLGISGDLEQYIRQLNNLEYNSLDPTISKIFDLSHNLCSEYNHVSTSPRRRKDILDILFFMHGKNLNVGASLHCDILGTVKIGDNVNIGNGVSLAGNIDIGNNVILEDNCLLQAIGHKTHYFDRRLCNDYHGNICEINVPGFIKIVDGITLAKNTKVAGGNVVDYNTTTSEIIR